MAKKIKTQETQSYTDVMILGQSHSMMAGYIPDSVDIKSAMNIHREKSNLSESCASFGFWGSNLNYNTYYPDVSNKDLTPKDSEFIEPMFRLLSACIVSKNYNPTDFSEPGVLESSMSILKGQTVNCDHDTEVGNAIGVVKDVEWQESFIQDGVEVPAGINGILKIDGKSNPRIARGIMMSPPSIHSNSVTVTFQWKPSHVFDDIWDFYNALGTYTESGELVRRIVTKIISYSETSLVSHGADPFAQLLNGGKLNHIVHAAQSYYGSMSNSDQLIKDIPNRVINRLDYKELGNSNLGSYLGTLKNSSKEPNNFLDKEIIKPNQNNNEMDKTLLAFIEQGLLKLNEGEQFTPELALTKIKAVLEQSLKDETELSKLKEDKLTLENEVNSLKANAVLGETYMAKLREDSLTNYKKLAGEKPDEAIVSLLSDSNTTDKTLIAMNNMYIQQLEEKYPMSCSKCGSKDVNRGSSLDSENEHEGSESHSDDNPTSISKTIDEIIHQRKHS